MCGRYTIKSSPELIKETFQVQIPEILEPNYNLAPTQNGLVITADEPGIAQQMHFGLVPYWSVDTKLNFSTLNAKSEEVMEKKTYAPLIKNHKTCLVIADGFIEWDKKSGVSLPYLFFIKDQPVFAFAGLWSQWKSKSGDVVYRSFTILTTEANETVGRVHAPKNRMPVILEEYQHKLWLDKELSPNELLDLCQTYPDEKMDLVRVSTEINAAVVKGAINNRPELILPINSL